MSKRLGSLVDGLCGLLSAVALFAIMALTFADVIGRKVVSHSVTGSLELTELLMVVVIFSALPIVSRRSEHVEFDSLDAYLPLSVRRLQRCFVQLTCGIIMLGVAWIMWQSAEGFAQSGETSVQLLIPKAPFVYGIAVSCAVTGFVHLALALTPPPAAEEASGAVI